MAGAPTLERSRTRRRLARWLRLGALVGVLALGAGSFLMLHGEKFLANRSLPSRSSDPTTEPAAAEARLQPARSAAPAPLVSSAEPPPVSAPPVPAPAAAVRSLSLPALAASDELVRKRATTIAPRAALARLLASEALIRRFVGASTSIALGENPMRHLQSARPNGRLQTSGDGGSGFTVDSSSYARFEPIVRSLAAVDTGLAVALFDDLEPLCDQAYREFGYAEGRFEPVLVEAIETLLDTPLPDGPIAVEPAAKTWVFADPDLEALDPAQRLLLRLGPENGRILRAKLAELRDALVRG